MARSCTCVRGRTQGAFAPPAADAVGSSRSRCAGGSAGTPVTSTVMIQPGSRWRTNSDNQPRQSYFIRTRWVQKCTGRDLNPQPSACKAGAPSVELPEAVQDEI